MPAATLITPIDRPEGQYQQFSFTLTPGAILTLAGELETIALAGLNIGDGISVSPRSGLQLGLSVGYARVVSANNAEFSINNGTAGTLTPTAGIWTATIMRGTTMVFVR